MKLSGILAGILILLMIGIASQSAHAEDKWEFSTAPYIWMVGLDGDMTVKGNKSEVSMDFGDILDDLDIALEVHTELWKGDWGGFFDGTYVKLEAEGGSGPIDIDITNEIVLIDFGMLYSVGTWSLWNEPSKAAKGKANTQTLELLIGGRYTNLDVELDPKHASSVDTSKDWIDLIVGGRLLFNFSEQWSLLMRGDIGGFNISGSPDFTSNGSALIRWKFDPQWTLLAGYRALYQDYVDGSGNSEFKYHITSHGPMLGVNYIW